MGKLEEALVQRLVETSSTYKRDVMEETIRRLLGAHQLTDITGLPARRGPADGGFDGVMTISHLINQHWTETTAGLNVKVRGSKFTREQLGGFLLDMDRENISSGIIITAAGLSPDAQAELNRKNNQGDVSLIHIRLADILAGQVITPHIQIKNQNLRTLLTDNLNALLEKQKKTNE